MRLLRRILIVLALTTTGLGLTSPPSAHAVPPPAPKNVFADPRDGAAVVKWQPNAGDWDAFRITASPGGKTAITNAQSVTVTGLTNGTKYTFTVKNVLNGESSAASAPSPAITVGAPGGFLGTLWEGDSKMELTCDKGPQLTNGSPITSLTMLWKDTGQVFTIPYSNDQCSYVVKNLTNQKSYFATVTLKNARGSTTVNRSGVPRGTFTEQIDPGYSTKSVKKGSIQKVTYYVPFSIPSDRFKIELLNSLGTASVLTTTALRSQPYGGSYSWLVSARMGSGTYRLRVTNLTTVNDRTSATSQPFSVVA